MTPTQRELVYKLVISGSDPTRRISLEDFAREFPAAVARNSLSPDFLREVGSSENSKDLQAALIIGAAFGFSESSVPELCRLLRLDWHTSHEEIASILQRLKAPEAVDALVEAAQVSHAYLSYDEQFGLARKCSWALADIGTTSAKNGLLRLAADSSGIKAAYARKRLENWDSELGRKGK
jgi:HEAT repeat protein